MELLLLIVSNEKEGTGDLLFSDVQEDTFFIWEREIISLRRSSTIRMKYNTNTA